MCAGEVVSQCRYTLGPSIDKEQAGIFILSSPLVWIKGEVSRKESTEDGVLHVPFIQLVLQVHRYVQGPVKLDAVHP